MLELTPSIRGAHLLRCESCINAPPIKLSPKADPALKPPPEPPPQIYCQHNLPPSKAQSLTPSCCACSFEVDMKLECSTGFCPKKSLQGCKRSRTNKKVLGFFRFPSSANNHAPNSETASKVWPGGEEEEQFGLSIFWHLEA